MKKYLAFIVFFVFIFVFLIHRNELFASPLAKKTVAEHVADLEAEGLLPRLDRSHTLVGPDTNNNGVRDDIEGWIATQSLTTPLVRAAMQLAASYQAAIMVDTSNLGRVQEVFHAGSRAFSCLSKVMQTDRAYELSRTLEGYTLNTMERVKAYSRYSQALDGAVMSLPKNNSCS
jgi:hypothetical protein